MSSKVGGTFWWYFCDFLCMQLCINLKIMQKSRSLRCMCTYVIFLLPTQKSTFGTNMYLLHRWLSANFSHFLVQVHYSGDLLYQYNRLLVPLSRYARYLTLPRLS